MINLLILTTVLVGIAFLVCLFGWSTTVDRRLAALEDLATAPSTTNRKEDS